MADKAIGNFAFVYHINRKLYTKLYSAEKQARTDFRNSGHESREALEIFIRSILNKYGLEQACRGQDLRTKIDNLRDERFLRAAGYLKNGECIADKRILPDIGTITYRYENGREGTSDLLDFIRRFGNTCSHADIRSSDIEVSYANTVKCLKGLFQLFKRFYKGKISSAVGGFDENRMPIEEYCVYDSYVPDDTTRSKCIREFLAYTLDENGEKKFYAILRLYNKQNSEEIFMLRNQKCFTEASKVSFSAVPDGMAKMIELIPSDSQNSSFYLISYVFNQKPYPIDNSLLEKLDLDQRLKFCCRIVNCLNNLHKSPTPIYHRMLNYDCVFACEIRGEWIPYIVKFDYAKILMNIGTVQADAARAKSFLKTEAKLNKYIAPEWDSLTSELNSEKWGKADIYSLGVLCSDILFGKIDITIPSIEDLEELGLSEDMLDMLDIMRADDPEERWNIDDVKDTFDEEQRRNRNK